MTLPAAYFDGSAPSKGLVDEKNQYTEHWDDLRFPAQGINPAGSPSPASIDNTTRPGTLLFASNSTQHIGGVAQIPHAWKRNSALRPHVHWAKTSSASGGVVWQFRYAVADIGSVIPAYSAWAGGTNAVSDSDTADKHAITSFSEIDMTGLKESTIVLWEIRRKHDDAADDYGADARLLEFDIHYLTNKRGTNTEIPE